MQMHSPVSATSSEKQKIFRYVNYIAARAINRGSRLALQERSEVDDLSLVLAFDDANEGDLLEVCLRSESSSLHNSLQNSRRSFKDDFPGFLHGTGNNHRNSPGIQSNDYLVILKLRLVTSGQLLLELANSLAGRSSFSN